MIEWAKTVQGLPLYCQCTRRNELKITVIFVTLLLLASNIATAAPRIVFSGTPELRINDMVVARSETQVASDQRSKFKVVITEDNGRFFWTTRENNEMSRSINGAYVTYTATNGTGYVRVEDSAAHRMMESKVAAYRFDYKEHLQQGLTSVTYYGKADK